MDEVEGQPQEKEYQLNTCIMYGGVSPCKKNDSDLNKILKERNLIIVRYKFNYFDGSRWKFSCIVKYNDQFYDQIDQYNNKSHNSTQAPDNKVIIHKFTNLPIDYEGGKHLTIINRIKLLEDCEF